MHWLVERLDSVGEQRKGDCWTLYLLNVECQYRTLRIKSKPKMAGAVMLIMPGWQTDIMAVAVGAAAIGWHLLKAQQSK